MPQLFCKCGAPATAARLYPATENRPVCILCASIDRLEIPSIPERSVAIPDHLLGSRSQQIHPHNTVYNHQAVALNLLYEGHNVVVSTPTASGKTLVFMMHVLHITETDPDATALVFYPAKALANDQLIRWKAAANAAEMDPEAVQQITGDMPMRNREAILDKASVTLVTPDVVHAWLIRTARAPAQKRFLANLQVAVTDEAHVCEDVLGSNAAFMFRRLDAATTHAQNRYFIQYIAATATIRSPEKHMKDLTGRTFTKVDIDENGAPTHLTLLLHVPYAQDEKNPESAASRLLTSINDNDPNAQAILSTTPAKGRNASPAWPAGPTKSCPTGLDI